MSEKANFERTELLIGADAMRRMNAARVILFGVGGVGSWCAESLIRSGIRHLTLVDSDCVNETNINRQLPATTLTVGEAKVDVLKKRLLEINPEAEITTIQGMYNAETAASFQLESYDYILDAIDSLEEKAHLIRTATQTDAEFFSSMGAALKMDPSRIRTAEFWKVQGCPLAAALRRKLKKGQLPGKKFACVFSDEVLANQGTLPEAAPPLSGWDARKARINGTLAHITAIFGFTLAGLVIKDIYTSIDMG
ncbi:tRNA threonylcarbamoyladenosine dehydratase [Tannerella sp.]|uniref:tRNA threonylcarbamoyladenosine dehydratase n=1 Tax=Tannerella sp. TaxID=2382127 RepID=UPI0026DD3AB7|nr:tRNA threonylcarbamoyladenosine dehydratase [Tannerella sp.]MDO4703505.1 tRNA threonylcarbamoyladenosine dehydratase [Tannerella sp.]